MKFSVIVFVLSNFLTGVAMGANFYAHSLNLNSGEFSEWLSRNHELGFKDSLKGKNILQNLNRLPISADLKLLKKALSLLDQLPQLSSEIESSIFIYQKIGIENLSRIEKMRYLGLLSTSEESLMRHENEVNHLTSALHSIGPSDSRFWIEPSELKNLHNFLNSPDSAIIVDGINLLSLDQKVSNQRHQWLYLSNTNLPILFVGDLQGFLIALIGLKPIEGQCGEVIVPWPELKELRIKSIGTDTNCQPEVESISAALNNPMGTNIATAAHERTTAWALPVAIIGTGIALSYFKNKQVTFHTPNLRF